MTRPRPSRSRPEPLTEARRDALLKLLADDDPPVYPIIREEILARGDEVWDWLGDHSLSDEPLVRRRARELRDVLARRKTDTEFLAFCLRSGEEFNLEQGVWLIARTRHPELNLEGYTALLDDWAGELRGRLLAYEGAQSRLAVLNEFIYDDLGFKGNEQNYYDPDNSYMNRVIDRRTGNPISLCLFYIFLARRVGLPVTGIGFPGHFLCRYQSPREEHYIDAFNGGKLLSKQQCIQYLKQHGLGVREGYLVPVTARRVLLRICANLHQIYLQLSQPKEADRIQHYLVALAK